MSADKNSHVEQLVSRYAAGRSVKQIERDNQLAYGALANFLKPSRGHGLVQLHVMERFATALGAPLREVSQAFVRDAGLGDDTYADDEILLINTYRALGTDDKDRIRAMAATFLEMATTRESNIGHPNE